MSVDRNQIDSASPPNYQADIFLFSVNSYCIFAARMLQYISCQAIAYADVAQSVERILGKDEVTGSNPVISSITAPNH